MRARLCVASLRCALCTALCAELPYACLCVVCVCMCMGVCVLFIRLCVRARNVNVKASNVMSAMNMAMELHLEPRNDLRCVNAVPRLLILGHCTKRGSLSFRSLFCPHALHDIGKERSQISHVNSEAFARIRLACLVTMSDMKKALHLSSALTHPVSVAMGKLHWLGFRIAYLAGFTISTPVPGACVQRLLDRCSIDSRRVPLKILCPKSSPHRRCFTHLLSSCTDV